MHELQAKYGKDWIDIIDLGEDLGVSTARNTGWDKSNQEYVAFLDSDDSWHSKKIEIQYNFMKQHPDHVMTGHDFQILGEKSTSSDFDFDKYKVQMWPFNKVLLKNPMVTPSVMVKKDIPLRYQAGRSDMDDHLLQIEISHKYGPIPKIMLPLAKIYKPQYGSSGLSSRMWTMEKGNQKNYAYLCRHGMISSPVRLALSFQSYLRFFKRLMVVYVWRRLRGTTPLKKISI